MNTITKKPSSDKELLTRLAVLVDPMKTPKPMQKEIEEVWNICRKITGIIDWFDWIFRHHNASICFVKYYLPNT